MQHSPASLTSDKVKRAWQLTPTPKARPRKTDENEAPFTPSIVTPFTPHNVKSAIKGNVVPPSQTKSVMKVRKILEEQGFDKNVARHASVTCKGTVSAAVQYALDYKDHVLNNEGKVQDSIDGESKTREYQSRTSSRRFNMDDDLEETSRPVSNVSLQKQLLAQGFLKADVNRAVRRCNTVESAINYILEWEEIEEATEKRFFECALCMDDQVRGDEIVTLSCDHRFCRSCLKYLIELKLKEKNVTEEDLCCPERGCGVPLDLKIIEATLGEAVYQKLLDVKLRRMYVRNTTDARECPKCSHVMIIEENDEKLLYDVTCPRKGCGHKFCGRCGQKPHKNQKDLDLSCEQYADFVRKNDEGLKKFHEFMKKEGLRQCPKCRRVGELKSGCKFVYCTCKANYCYLCGRELHENQHYSHFQKGPYGKICYGGGIDKKGRIAEPRCIGCSGRDCEKCSGKIQAMIDKETEKTRKRIEARKNRRGLWAYLFGGKRQNKK
eukprot:g11078.t1